MTGIRGYATRYRALLFMAVLLVVAGPAVDAGTPAKAAVGDILTLSLAPPPDATPSSAPIEKAGSNGYEVFVMGQLQTIVSGADPANQAVLVTGSEGVVPTTFTTEPDGVFGGPVLIEGPLDRERLASTVLRATAFRNVPTLETASGDISVPLLPTLTIETSGPGAISATYPGGTFTCASPTCTEPVPFGENVHLLSHGSKSPATWSGACTSEACVVPMTRSQTVRVGFASPPITSEPEVAKLTLELRGATAGALLTMNDRVMECLPSCDTTLPVGTYITLAATPGTNALFEKWSRDDCGASSTCSFRLDRDTVVTGDFGVQGPGDEKVRHTLRVVRVGDGRVRMTSSPGGIRCATGCEAEFDQGETVDLNFLGRGGWKVASLEGDCFGSATACTVMMSEDRTVTVRLRAPGGSDVLARACEDLPMGCVADPDDLIRQLRRGPAAPWMTILALLVLLALIGFPSSLFNSTYEENYDAISARLSRLPSVLPFRSRSVSGILLGALAIGAIYTATQEDKLHDAAGRVVTGLAFALAFLVVSAAFGLPEYFVAKRAGRGTRVVQILPSAMVVALLCALVTWQLELEPGYMYGAIISVSWIGFDHDPRRGRAAWYSAALAVGVGLVALLVWGGIDEWANVTNPALVPLFVGVLVKAVIIGCAEALVFDFAPFRFLKGERLKRWNVAAWLTGWVAALVVAVALITTSVHANGQFDYEEQKMPQAYVAVLAFGTFSIWFWRHFRTRNPFVDDDPTEAVAELGDPIEEVARVPVGVG